MFNKNFKEYNYLNKFLKIFIFFLLFLFISFKKKKIFFGGK
jgi:hypothetical protein